MQRDYYVLQRALSQAHPLLAWDQSASAFRKGRPVEVGEPVKLRLGDPVPPRPVMADHHSLPAPVVSERLRGVLDAAELRGVQLVPADVQVGDSTLRYWLVHMWRTLRCVDRERSVYEDSDSGLFMVSLDRLVLDESVLQDVPLEERRAFRLAESTVHLFHRDVVARVQAMVPPPEGLRFVPVEEWGDASRFR
ncbi:hypothetical protein FJV41_48275 [Myxococcus llanfairpwllgwyngyllgogerychwyrndrobwllllantysiliogogogochensis]|uniref:Immunity MXAN-0049 protein domain-containing protein n=1 Tax=Myxococcus llanfairpwllgwyngyllgogerychwyrndrobwllllantysiliogogogochensis TaxID=2590453 RepID=A0A540WIC4_9BACT|nr:DUF1629 domain-containing protein [Myxococcus llanfairpwllgwyngyllgogerychwyrndrobwllllantysiliogogogochensis]TQF08742.1 hypothetical protein FJV41_48275 [Myxococcus llanfairpwllgwyngyllgogerychwyrndrobwllllantysiliogogogochensis]